MSEDKANRKSLAQLMRELFASPEFKAKQRAWDAFVQAEWTEGLRKSGIVFDQDDVPASD